ncbi:nuclease-related domain-containing protein [Gracilibacillus sp. S3-1-1]|uniref:Nuclease-related domain-containing protein n=1 Tax=Gracilibacillus pellucidus TaxID=3095368 RepID=A0ACC6M3S6_9BACI|nr:nuclease-related domain-containing protein [Gracilibacillus sp. S3-1-1]MDX8045589.1 nuclease-related domain-containing protein [Gracilibacillus sp. S3-1-1]
MIREKPYELQLYELLNKRKMLSNNESKKYRQLQTGYQGELLFDQYVQHIAGEYLSIKDLSLSFKQRYFQLDQLLIINNQIYLFEVKNYRGEFAYQKGKLYKDQATEIDDPLIQLRRSESLLRQLLAEWKMSFSIEAKVVFVHPECTLYLPSSHPNILLPTQIKSFFRSISPSSISDPAFYSLVIKLKENRLHQSPYQQLPSYHFDELKKGITCKKCGGITQTRHGRTFICNKCNNQELIIEAIVRNIQEFQLLFPDDKITSKRMTEWCGSDVTKRTIQYVLINHFVKKGSHKGTYYINDK